MELKVANKHVSVRDDLQNRRRHRGVWDNELLLGQQVSRRAAALPAEYDGEDEEDWPVVQVLVIDALNAHRELAGADEGALEAFLSRLTTEVRESLTSGAYGDREEIVAHLKGLYFFTGTPAAPRLSRGFRLFPK